MCYHLPISPLVIARITVPILSSSNRKDCSQALGNCCMSYYVLLTLKRFPRPEKAVEQTGEMPMIRYAMKLMLSRCDLTLETVYQNSLSGK